MQKLIALCLFVALAFAVEVTITDQENVIDSQYIILFHDNVTEDQRGNHVKTLYKNIADDSKIIAIYNFGSFHGFAAKLSDSLLETQKQSSLISLIETDITVHATRASCTQQSNAVWGLDRISKREVNLDGKYKYETTSGQGVDAYIVDTGIQINHADFGGRAIWGANFVDTQNTDCNGHGTHVAGTVGSTTYGVAKKSTLIAVKVLNCAGSGSNAGVISGIQWTVTSFNSRKRPSVANMSLGGGKSTATDNAVNSAVAAGMTFAVAAGNDNADACNYSPAAAASAISVGATGIDDDISNQVDSRAYFSNYGSCVTVFAPGLMIESTWIGTKNTEVKTISGTSMASPHVAGIVAAYLGTHPTATPAAVENWILNEATDNVIQLDCSGASSQAACNRSPNVFVHSPRA